MQRKRSLANNSANLPLYYQDVISLKTHRCSTKSAVRRLYYAESVVCPSNDVQRQLFAGNVCSGKRQNCARAGQVTVYLQ